MCSSEKMGSLEKRLCPSRNSPNKVTPWPQSSQRQRNRSSSSFFYFSFSSIGIATISLSFSNLKLPKPKAPFLAFKMIKQHLDVGSSPSPSPSPPLSFSSPSSLSDFLRSHIPPDSLSSWGVSPGSKTLHNLWIELSHGDSSLSSSCRRTVNVAILLIKNARGATLLESHQLLSDGTVRTRNRPLSEKMLPGEPIEEAAARALREELGGGVRARLAMDTYLVREEEAASSVSYPGLPVRYVLHSVEAVLEEGGGIPEEGEFATEESGEGKEEDEKNGQAKFVQKHFWKWCDYY